MVYIYDRIDRFGCIIREQFKCNGIAQHTYITPGIYLGVGEVSARFNFIAI